MPLPVTSTRPATEELGAQMSNQDPVVLGIDGGATKTACTALFLATKEKAAQAYAGPSNWSSVGRDASLQSLKTAISETLGACKRSWDAVAAICLGMAGVDTPHDQAALTAAIRDWFPQHTLILVYNDAVPALVSGTEGELEGCVLIAGTGSIAFAVRRDGSSARAAGCGPAFLDGGCGYDLGQKGLSAAAKGSDGRGPQTKLLEYFCTHYPHVASLSELVRWVYAEPGWARIAGLAPSVVACAQEGDKVAHQILQGGAADLANTVQAAVGQLHMPPPFNLVLAGGLMRPGYAYTELCRVALKVALPQAHVTFPEVDAATGAALLAIKHLKGLRPCV